MENEKRKILINITELLKEQGFISEAEKLTATNIINKDI